MLISLERGIWAKGGEGDPSIRCASGKTKAGDRENVPYLRRLGEDRCDLLADILGVLQRCSRRRLHSNDQVTLVLVGDEALWHTNQYKIGHCEAGEKQNHRNYPVVEESAQGAPVAFGYASDYFVDLGKEPTVLATLASQQDRRKRRSESQCIESRNGNGECDSECELPEKNSRRAGKERDRQEHGHQHQGGCDDRSGHLFHGS